jgi:hypothetical protein
MDPLTLEWLKHGVMGLVIVGQSIAIAKLYRDLNEAREDVDEAREDHLEDLRRLNTRLSGTRSGDSWG